MHVPSGKGRVMDVRGIYAEFPTLDPDVLLRYRRIVEQIPFRAGILEIGRGDVGLAHLLGAPSHARLQANPSSEPPGISSPSATHRSMPWWP